VRDYWNLVQFKSRSLVDW